MKKTTQTLRKGLVGIAMILVFAACGSGGGDAQLASDVPMVEPMARMASPDSADPLPLAPRSAAVMDGDMIDWSVDVEAVEMSVPFAAAGEVATAPGTTLREEESRQATEQRRIIRNAQVEMETYEFDGAMNILREIPTNAGGYIEHSSLNTHSRIITSSQSPIRMRTFDITMRVPEPEFNTVLNRIEQIATVTVSRQFAQDVTDQFYDTQTRLETRLIEEGRILALIEQAETLSEILDLEQRLSAIRLQIGRYRSSLNSMIQQTTYSTINITLWELIYEEEDEEEEYIPLLPPTFIARIGNALSSSWNGTISALQEFAVLFAGAIIPLAVIGVLAGLGYKIYLRYRIS